MACRRLIERLAALNCAAPSAQLPEPARHVTDSNRPTDEQMHAGVLVCVRLCLCVCACVVSTFCLYSGLSFLFLWDSRLEPSYWRPERQMQMSDFENPRIFIMKSLCVQSASVCSQGPQDFKVVTHTVNMTKWTDEHHMRRKIISINQWSASLSLAQWHRLPAEFNKGNVLCGKMMRTHILRISIWHSVSGLMRDCMQTKKRCDISVY